MTTKLTTEAYSVSGDLIPEAEYDVLSSFAVESSEGEHPNLVLGLWVKRDGECQMDTIYLTEEQRQAIELLWRT